MLQEQIFSCKYLSPTANFLLPTYSHKTDVLMGRTAIVYFALPGQMGANAVVVMNQIENGTRVYHLAGERAKVLMSYTGGRVALPDEGYVKSPVRRIKEIYQFRKNLFTPHSPNETGGAPSEVQGKYKDFYTMYLELDQRGGLFAVSRPPKVLVSTLKTQDPGTERVKVKLIRHLAGSTFRDVTRVAVLQRDPNDLSTWVLVNQQRSLGESALVA